MTHDELTALINAIKMTRSAATDETAIDAVAIFPAWKVGIEQSIGDRVRDADKLWKCLQAHTTQEGWEPHLSPSLYVEVAKPGEYREIKSGMLPTEAFALNEIGWYQIPNNLYKSLIDANTFTPDDYPTGWEKL